MCGPARSYDDPPQPGGPLALDGSVERGLRVMEPVDVGLVPLGNASGTPVVIDAVHVEDAAGELPLQLLGAFVADGDTPLAVARAGHYPARLDAAACHRVPPADQTTDLPYLVLRVAPGSASAASQNGTVDVTYHTADGRDWVAVFLNRVRFEPD